jgi:hypothetical protein
MHSQQNTFTTNPSLRRIHPNWFRKRRGSAPYGLKGPECVRRFAGVKSLAANQTVIRRLSATDLMMCSLWGDWYNPPKLQTRRGIVPVVESIWNPMSNESKPSEYMTSPSDDYTSPVPQQSHSNPRKRGSDHLSDKSESVSKKFCQTLKELPTRVIDYAINEWQLSQEWGSAPKSSLNGGENHLNDYIKYGLEDIWRQKEVFP